MLAGEGSDLLVHRQLVPDQGLGLEEPLDAVLALELFLVVMNLPVIEL